MFPPPGGPAIVSVLEERFRNGVDQDIALFTSSTVPGQNSFNVKFVGGSAGFSTITQGSISREIRRALPGVSYSVSPFYLQNTYGPFGYASGSSGTGDTCMYAWQQIRAGEVDRSTLRHNGMIQIRLRLCDARASSQQLLSVMYGYTIAGTFSGITFQPFGAAPTADDALGRPGEPVYPDGMMGQRQIPPIGYNPATITVARRPSPPEARPVVAPIGPIVPLPDAAPQSMKSSNITVPMPNCVGPTGETQAC